MHELVNAINCGQVDICCAEWWKVVSYCCCCSRWHTNGDAAITKKLNPLSLSAGRMEVCMMKPEVKKKPKSVRTFTINTEQTQAMHNPNTSPIRCCKCIYSLQCRCFKCWSKLRVLAQISQCTSCILHWTSFSVESFKRFAGTMLEELFCLCFQVILVFTVSSNPGLTSSQKAAQYLVLVMAANCYLCMLYVWAAAENIRD